MIYSSKMKIWEFEISEQRLLFIFTYLVQQL